MPQSPSFRHDFSIAQLDLMKVYISRLNTAEAAKNAAETTYNDCRMNIGLFIDYLQKELKMQPDVIWTLAQAPDGMPYLSGSPKPPKAKE
jgi:hypothetical protein